MILEKRAIAFFIDYFIMSILGALTYLVTSDLILSMIIVYPLTMNKDFLNGKSIGKRISGIQVQDRDNHTANEWICSLRNFLPIIPIDILFAIFSPSRRIGDRIVGTKIGIEVNYNIKSIRTELKNYRINKNLVFGLINGVLNIYVLFILSDQLLSVMGK